MGEVTQWLSSALSSTHALVLAVLAGVGWTWRTVKTVLVKAALSDVRAETITELRSEIVHLRAEVEYYRSRGHGGDTRSGSTTPSSGSTGSDAKPSPPSVTHGLTWK